LSASAIRSITTAMAVVLLHFLAVTHSIMACPGKGHIVRIT
jgi:hypothetical protein